MHATRSFAEGVANRIQGSPTTPPKEGEPQAFPIVMIIEAIMAIIQMFSGGCPKPAAISRAKGCCDETTVNNDRVRVNYAIRRTMDEEGIPRRIGDVKRWRKAIQDETLARNEDELGEIYEENAYMGI